MESMQGLIAAYIGKHLKVSETEARSIHREYLHSYGLAIEGLVRHHKIDPLHFNQEVDDAIPLEDLIRPDPPLRKFLEDFDRSKVKLWLLTNAYVTHGMRVVKVLGVDDLFEGITYADYASRPLLCKPHPAMFERAMQDAGVQRKEDSYFVGASWPSPRSASFP